MLGVYSSRSRPRGRCRMRQGEPIVMHGWTMTAPCGFREVCEAVRDYAFVDNDLPIIVSLEVHADLEQQEVMVRIMKEVWGSMLIQTSFEDWDPKFRLPRLEDLLNKILIKVKKRPPGHSGYEPCNGENAVEDERLAYKNSPSLSTGPPKDTTPKVDICPNLGKLAIYTRSETYKGLATKEAKEPPHIFSISEGDILRLYEESPRDVFTHNKNYFMRAYPAGFRVSSSNPDPSLYWRKGVQMVAMNWQNLDEGMMLNEGMFADEKGWVLKPPGYRSSDKTVETQDQAAHYHTLDLTITVFAGQNVHTADAEVGHTAHPFVKAELHVEKQVDVSHKDEDAPECKYKDKTEPKRTDQPSWGPSGAVLSFQKIPKVVEELSFIRSVISLLLFLAYLVICSW